MYFVHYIQINKKLTMKVIEV